MKILITGGAGFVGSSLARFFSEESSKHSVAVLDNLKRRGSEINLPDFTRRGITFCHGDVRCPGDFRDAGGPFDLIIDASAEPSVHAGLNGSPEFLLRTNLEGTMNLLEYCRTNAGRLVFLSTSRVYSLEPLKRIALAEGASRFEIIPEQIIPGISGSGISEVFPIHLPRSLYGASKLASEMLIQEYCNAYGMKGIINRCGVIAGPGQFGRTDQGVFTLWVMRHLTGSPLNYTGFGGTGKQVRDLLHPRDLYLLMKKQLESDEGWDGEIFNAGGGLEQSVSLHEMTAICQEATGNIVIIKSVPDTSPFDVPLYISDNTNVTSRYGWKPEITPKQIVSEIVTWGSDPKVRELFS